MEEGHRPGAVANEVICHLFHEETVVAITTLLSFDPSSDPGRDD